LNYKLGTKDLDIKTLAVEALRRNLTVMEVLAIPEQDGWIYKGEHHDGESFVCSVYVARLWKEAGIFGNLSIIAAEQTPKDLYQMDIFNKTWQGN
jgi:hypothetical protein